MAGTIFISYRRGADSGFAGRLYDRLERSFGRERVFMDVDSIAPGEDFVAVLEAHVAGCDVFLALIGRGWLAATDAAGRPRLGNPDDFVRIEIAAALAQGKRVIPVVIDDVSLPRADDLPEEIKPLARRQALRIRHDRFRDDAERLVRALERVLTDVDAARQVEEEARQRRELERQRAEEEAHRQAKVEAASRAEEERLRAEEEAEQRAKDEERRRVEQEAVRRKVEETRQRREVERQRAEEEARRKAEAEATIKAEDARQCAGATGNRQQKDEGKQTNKEENKHSIKIFHSLIDYFTLYKISYSVIQQVHISHNYVTPEAFIYFMFCAGIYVITCLALLHRSSYYIERITVCLSPLFFILIFWFLIYNVICIFSKTGKRFQDYKTISFIAQGSSLLYISIWLIVVKGVDSYSHFYDDTRDTLALLLFIIMCFIIVYITICWVRIQKEFWQLSYKRIIMYCFIVTILLISSLVLAINIVFSSLISS